jgi:hypothetical protein
MTQRLGRPYKLIDPMHGAKAQWGIDIQAALARMPGGRPTLRTLEAITGISSSVISDAYRGEKCPTWRTAEVILAACGEDPEVWRPQWDAIASPKQRMEAGVPSYEQQRAAYQRVRPENVRTVAELALGLRQLRLAQRLPTYRAISDRARRKGFAIAPSTISALLSGNTFPTIDALEGFLRGLGTPEPRPWILAWYDLAAEREEQRVLARSASPENLHDAA